ncbi:MAG: hypothetical protein HY246_21340 [Proteobacteria bacterium]|nr:hypothetical protein [Pseudomonadota bacterium]
MIPGVYAAGSDGKPVLVHTYQDGDYGLADVVELFELGQIEEASGGESGGIRLILTTKEMRQLKAFADAYSFDHEPGFIEMCLDLDRHATACPAERFEFTEMVDA